MKVSDSGGATAPSPLLIDLFAKPRSRSRQQKPLMSLPLFDWAEIQPPPPATNGDHAESNRLDQGGNDEVTP
jgi:hypothetical protein